MEIGRIRPLFIRKTAASQTPAILTDIGRQPIPRNTASGLNADRQPINKDVAKVENPLQRRPQNR